jgi:hypothetical protein
MKRTEFRQLHPGSVVFPKHYYCEQYGGSTVDLYLVIAKPTLEMLTLLSPSGVVIEFHYSWFELESKVM